MKKQSLFFASFMMLLFMSHAAYAVLGTPVTPLSIVFFSDRAMVTAVESKAILRTFKEGTTGFTLKLPATVDPSSLNVTINGVPAKAITWPSDPEFDDPHFEPTSTQTWPPHETLLPSEENDHLRKELLEKYNALKKEQATHKGKTKAIEASISFWEKSFSSASLEQNANFMKMETAMHERLPSLYTALNSEVDELLEVERKLESTKGALLRLDTAHRVRIAHISADKNTPAQSTLFFSYSMKAQSIPSYRVLASPSKKEITIEQLANITIQVPCVWKGVETFLTFTSLGTSLTPEAPQPWILDYSKEYPVQKMNIPLMASQRVAMKALSYDSITMPKQKELSKLHRWEIGKRDLPNNQTVQLVLASDTYKADFFYTIRPTVDLKGYLTADINFPAPVETPYGVASLYVDGTYIGKQYLSFNGETGKVYLGSDPLVTIQVNNFGKTRSTQGIIQKEQTGLWDWSMTVTNNRNRNVVVKVEDPAPVSLDKSIKVTTTSTPKPTLVFLKSNEESEPLHVFEWKKELEPNGKFVIQHKVEVSAEKGRDLSTDR